MVTLELCKKILNSGKRKYSDTDIREIRKFLYSMAEMQIEIEKKNKFNNIIGGKEYGERNFIL